MKLLSFTVFTIISFSSYAVEFSSCTDNKGQTHFTNLPESSLDSNCAPIDHYSVMLNEDYQNLPNEYAKYLEDDVKDNNSQAFELSNIDISPDSVKRKVKDIFDPDKALEELMESTEDRDDVFTRAMRGRAEGIQDIINQSNTNTPDNM